MRMGRSRLDRSHKDAGDCWAGWIVAAHAVAGGVDAAAAADTGAVISSQVAAPAGFRSIGRRGVVGGEGKRE